MEVVKVAVLSRVLVVGLSVASVLVVGSYDTSAVLEDQGGFWVPLGWNWDAQYMVTIASHGYEMEQFHAFLPVLPWTMGTIGGVLFRKLQWFASLQAAAAFVGVVVGNVCHIVATYLLYRVTKMVFGYEEERFSRRVAVLFAFNPASVFMSASYTESLYALCSFLGMYILERKKSRNEWTHDLPILLFSAAPFALATLTRANGAVLGGYIGYFMLKPFLEGRHVARLFPLLKAGLILVSPLLLSSVVPIASYLFFAYQQYCFMNPPSWCGKLIPNVYSYVQAEYWGNGFLKYYELKQIPNFLLAFPMLYLCTKSITHFTLRHQLTLTRSLPYLLHLGFMVIFCTLFMHVQVMTRFVSACPPIYWYVATLESKDQELMLILTYFAIYVCLGTSMFSCFYPWT